MSIHAVGTSLELATTLTSTAGQAELFPPAEYLIGAYRRSPDALRFLQTLTPARPGMERSIQELRRAPPPELGKLTLSRIADSYAKHIAGRTRQPLLIGHSYGGLVVQMPAEPGPGNSICKGT